MTQPIEEWREAVDEELDNTTGLARDAIRRTSHLEIAVRAMISALDDRMPGFRTVVLHIMEEDFAEEVRVSQTAGFEIKDDEIALFEELLSRIKHK
jgi:hypothetical protein